uniref:Alpha-2-macroglobulin domain-containing protein n=1 Tax=Setaria digitata TaxID=48799 RepID=A0A915PNP5_9BILA
MINSSYWSDRVNVNQCNGSTVASSSTGLIKLTAEVLDQGTGNQVKSDVKIDNNLAGFELIPLKPGYGRNSSNITILIKSVDGRLLTWQEVSVDVRCISTDKKQTLHLNSYKGKINSLLTVPFLSSLYENDCRVILIQARRKISERLSRAVTLMLPSADHSESLQYGWIQWSPPRNATYRVGEKFRASVPAHLATKLNYLVVCQDETFTEGGRVRDDGQIIFETTTTMVPYCALYVFSVHETVKMDMILFFVELFCENSVAVSEALVGVSDNLTVTINGTPNSLAVLSVVDIRMLELMQKYSSHSASKYWDLSMVERPLQTLFLGLLNPKNLSDEIRGTCEEAGILMLQHLKSCPNFVESPSAISNHCFRSFILACERLTGQTTTGKVCNRKTGRGCDSGEPVKLAGTQLQFKMSSFISSSEEEFEDFEPVGSPNKPDFSPIIRQYFPEVWHFEDYGLGESGTMNLTILVPDSVTQWSLHSSVWTPGELAICQTPSVTVTTQKELFMTVDLPQHVYVNESVTARVSVFAERLEEDMTFSVCVAKLDRHVCGDIGANGERGQPAYSRVHLTTTNTNAAKIFTLRFLHTGETEVMFVLKEEVSYPGRYHCDVGGVYDTVKLKVIVAKRAETKEHFRRLVLNPLKPLSRLKHRTTSCVHYSVSNNETETEERNAIDYYEHRSEQDPQKFFTNININLPDTELIHGITIDLSQFLSEGSMNDPFTQNEAMLWSNYRWKRSIVGHESFLTDIIGSLASTLYQFKSLVLPDKKSHRTSESFSDIIGSLMSAMLTFSNCHGAALLSCAFSNYRNPKESNDESFFLTALSTSLLCEADVDERIICPLLSYLLGQTKTNIDAVLQMDYFLDHLGFTTAEDKYWFVKAIINQLASDCAIYQCVQNDLAWISLRMSFFNLSDQTVLDIRTVAALAFMAPQSISNIMRVKLYSITRDDMLPYWSVEKIPNNDWLLTEVPRQFSDKMKHKTITGDLFVNSMGLLAFLNRGAESTFPLIELDLLADWIYEQLNEIGQTPSALDAYFANRAIYEYRMQKTIRCDNNHNRVTILCKECKLMAHDVANTPIIFYLPVTVRNITLVTEGFAKVRTGIRVLTTKKLRLRRGLDQNDLYPIRINILQHVDTPGIIRQEVCLEILTPLIEMVEVTHGLFTGFSSQYDLFQIHQNTTVHGVRLLDRVVVSSYAVHFILTNLKAKIPLCYQLEMIEPNNTYEPDELAPVPITLRHPLYDVAGEGLITFTERFKRSLVEEVIDMICWDGSCSCAEATCTVRCSQCQSVTKNHVEHEVCSENMFAATVEVESYRNETVRGSDYFIIDVSLKHWKGNDVKMTSLKHDRIEVWLRECNIRCAEPKVGDIYYFSGNINGFVLDFNTKVHYILREDDRWELANEECGHLFAHLITSRPCPS